MCDVWRNRMSQKTFELVIRKKTSKQITAVLATEYPVQRGYETEVLRITPDSVNRERFPPEAKVRGSSRVGYPNIFN